jgi:hypothetical protein
MISILKSHALLICSLLLGCEAETQNEVRVSRVISHGALPSRHALAEFNDAAIQFKGKEIFVAPSGEGYLIITDENLIKTHGDDLLKFVSSRIKR